MRYAIVESGGKQYRAVEGETIEVDRLPVEIGEKVDLMRVLMLVDGETFTIGAPTVSEIQVSATVVDHIKASKVVSFKYSPKKRIRVKSGHRQQYTRLMVDGIGKPGESRKAAKVEKTEAPAETSAEAKPGATKKQAPKAKAEAAPVKGKKETTSKKSSTSAKTTKATKE